MESAVRARLDACLLDDSLAAADSRLWAGRPNPFPEIRMVEQVAGPPGRVLIPAHADQ